MGRAKRCKICLNGDPALAAQVNALIESGVRLKVIAEQLPEFSPFQLSRHKRNCLTPKPVAQETGSAEINKWLERAESTYLVAQSNGDARSAVSAISTAVRALTSLHKQVEREAEAAEKRDDPSALTIENIDKLVREYAVRVEQERGTCLSCGSPRNREGQNELIAN